MAQSVAPSPLAQLFQPLVVDDDVIPEDSENGPDSGGMLTGVSYGPASRRRLMSITQKRPIEAASQAMRWGASTVANKLLGEQPLSASPDQQRIERERDAEQEEEDPQPETAEQVQQEEQDGGGEPKMMRKLRLMEDRQKRIEDLLIQLNERIGSR